MIQTPFRYVNSFGVINSSAAIEMATVEAPIRPRFFTSSMPLVSVTCSPPHIRRHHHRHVTKATSTSTFSWSYFLFVFCWPAAACLFASPMS
jgi:hypothetical protein